MKACISYDDLHDASQEAHKVAKRFDDYADELQRKVLNKLAGYNGPWTSNMSNAYDLVSDKINELRTDYSRFEQYSIDLDELLDECKEVDTAVKTRVSQLTAAFKDANGIRNNFIENFLAYTFTALDNATAFGRFIGNAIDSFKARVGEIFESIKVWFNFEGGKQFLKALIVDGLKILGALIALAGSVVNLALAIAATVATEGAACGTIVVAAIGVFAALGNYYMTVIDVGTDLKHEGKALLINHNPEDAAMAYRLREINSLSDFMRNGFILDENDSTFFNKMYLGRRIAAISWDGLGIFFDVVDLVGSIAGIFTGEFELDWVGDVIAECGSIYDMRAEILDDGFQLSDLFELDPTGLWDLGSDIFDLVNDNFSDRPIERSVIHNLGRVCGIHNIQPISINIPQISVPSFEIPLIQVPHIPVFGC